MSYSVTPWTLAHQAPLSVGVLQARILESVAIPFSRGSSRPRDQTHISCISALQADSLPAEPPGKPHKEAACKSANQNINFGTSTLCNLNNTLDYLSLHFLICRTEVIQSHRSVHEGQTGSHTRSALTLPSP